MQPIMQRVILFGFFVLIAATNTAQTKVENEPSTQQATRLGVFRNGWAYVSRDGDAFYMNTQGEKIRTWGPNAAGLGDAFAIEKYGQELAAHPNALREPVIGFEQNGLRGILNPKGEILIPAAYSDVTVESAQFWTLHKAGKKALYLPDGTVTAFFDDIRFLDGVYFDVKTGDDWHLYHHPSAHIVTQSGYEGFDYCGGCGSRSPYVYAKKNGKWGIIDWDENVLVPFVYDHAHRHMRSDNWVASFSKNGQPLIVHIPTKQEFDGEAELVSGALIARQDGKYGVYNPRGELAIPFAYDRIEAPNDNHFQGYYGHYLVVETAGLKGLACSDGEIVVPAEYDDVKVYDDYVVVRKGSLTSLFVRGSSEPRLQVEHGEIAHVNSYFYSSGSRGLAIFTVKKQAYYGLYFAESGVFIEPGFYDISLKNNAYFPDGVVIEADRQGQKTLFDTNGDAILPFGVESYEMYDVGGRTMVSVEVGGKWGLYDAENKKQIIPAQYSRFFHQLGDASSRLIRTALQEGGQPSRYFVYDYEGNEVIPDPLVSIEPIDSTYYLIVRDNEGQKQYAVFNKNTRTLEPLPYPMVSLSSSPRLLVVFEDSLVGKLYDVAARKTLKRKYDVSMFIGEVLVHDDPDSDDVPWELSYFSRGFAQVRNGKGWAGMINEKEKVVVEPKFGQVIMISGQYALVTEVEPHTGRMSSYYIGLDGERVFPDEYEVDDMFFFFTEDYAAPVVTLQRADNPTLVGLGNLETGNMLTEPVYSNIIPVYGRPLLLLMQDFEDEDRLYSTIRKHGLATKDGEILFEPIFDEIALDESSYDRSVDIFPLLVREGEKWRYINADGSYLPFEGDGRL